MITVAGYAPSLDLTYLVEELRLGSIQRSSTVVRCAGGKPLNLARAAATLGADVTVVAILGGDTGTAITHLLEPSGVTLIPVATATETRTCVSIAAADRQDLTEVYANAARIDDAVWAAFGCALDTALADRNGWLAVPGGAPDGLAPQALAQLVERAHSDGVRVAVDTHGPALAAAVAARPDVIKVNRAEASALVGPADDLVAVAEKIRRRTDGLVVLTDGSDGAVAVSQGQGWRATCSVRGGYPVGSGDAFLAGLLLGLDRERPLPSALHLAMAAGVANAQVPGPGRLSRIDTERAAAEVQVEPI